MITDYILCEECEKKLNERMREKQMNEGFSAWDLLIEKQRHRAILEQIKAEVEQLTDNKEYVDEFEDGYNVAMKQVLDIIDRHIKGGT